MRDQLFETLFALQPIQGAAERVAEAAVPAASATPTYIAFRKVEVHRAQVESSLGGDGRIDERDRAFLDKLRTNRGLILEDAAEAEQDVGLARQGRGASVT